MDWKVIRAGIKIRPILDADKVELAIVGDYQLVVAKGEYKDGDVVVVAPYKSILPDVFAEPFRKYLAGPDNNRIKTAQLRGTLSQGVVLPQELLPDWVNDVPLGEDISERLGIVKYEAPIPSALSGKVEQLEGYDARQFDLEMLAVNVEELVGQNIIVTEKLHGSQFNGLYLNGQLHVTSKGLIARALRILEDVSNVYWQAVRNDGLEEILSRLYGATNKVHIVGEVVPISGHGMSYGFNKPTIRIFQVKVNDVVLSYDEVPQELKDFWVPIVYRGPMETVEVDGRLCLSRDLDSLRNGMETVSGKNLHIREGVVFKIDGHNTGPGFKLINPKYKDTGEEIS
jgi:RNA ligase (TIGR02306 family)